MVVNMKYLLTKAKNNCYALPHFNVNNLEWAKFILEECNINNSPVILGISESAIEYMGGYNVASSLIYNLIHDLNINIPVVIHLDHGSSFESCKKAIDAGFTSVMIDASKLSINENIDITRKVVEYAKTKNVSVEAEIGGLEDTNNLAPIDDCIKLVKETKIDCLATSVGNKHGLYKEEPNLDFDRIKNISKSVNVPLVLHGATGIPDNQLKGAIQRGVHKINFNTELQIAWADALKHYFTNNPNIYDPRKIIKSGELSLKRKIKDKLIILGSIYKG